MKATCKKCGNDLSYRLKRTPLIDNHTANLIEIKLFSIKVAFHLLKHEISLQRIASVIINAIVITGLYFRVVISWAIFFPIWLITYPIWLLHEFFDEDWFEAFKPRNWKQPAEYHYPDKDSDTLK